MSSVPLRKLTFPGYGTVSLYETAPGCFEAHVSSYKLWGALRKYQDSGRDLERARHRVSAIYNELCPKECTDFEIVGPDPLLDSGYELARG